MLLLLTAESTEVSWSLVALCSCKVTRKYEIGWRVLGETDTWIWGYQNLSCCPCT